MPIVEILRGEFVPLNLGGGAAITNYGSWVVNNLVAEIQTDIAAAPYSFTMRSNTGRYKFIERDNIEILSVWCCLPYHFIWSRPGPSIQVVRGDVLNTGPIQQVSPPSGRVVIPIANSEIAIGVYVPWGGVPAGSYMSIGAQIIGGWVSQIGAAAILNGVRLYPTICMKILHNLPIIA